MSIVQSKPVTPEELLAMPDGKHFELVNGELVEKNVGVVSSYVEGEILTILRGHCKATNAGLVFPSSLGIRCFPSDPTKIRRPDVIFVKQDRYQKPYWDEGFLPIAPDLAVEVISPNDHSSEVSEKVEEYLAAGIPLVWIVDPEIKTIVIHRADGTVTKLYANDELTGETVISGFRCKVADLFPATAS